jgi:hypothetical protein
MSPMVVGAGVATVLAGPPLYALVEAGQMDGSTAILRGLMVALACAVGARYVMRLVDGYEKEWLRKVRIDAILEAAADDVRFRAEQEAADLAAEQELANPPPP